MPFLVGDEFRDQYWQELGFPELMAPGIEKAEFDPRLPKMQINLIESIEEAASERDQIELEHKARVDELDLIKNNSN